MQPDTVLAGKYRLVSLLGHGGMGSVWRAEHLGLRAPVAIKLLTPALVSRPDSATRFFREAQSAANLRSPHVVQILDHGVDEVTQVPFIAMELMEGESLADRLARVRTISPADTYKIILHATRALTRAHELSIVHRDLKPGNLFLVRNDDDELVKVLDFGLAKWRLAPSLSAEAAATVTGQLLGTPYYMSPEQLDDGGTVDHRSDLWALGVIAFECLIGRRPYEGENLIGIALKICGAKVPQIPPELGLPPGLASWFARALAKEPGSRFQSARELAEELRRALSIEAATRSSSSAPALVSLAPPSPTPAAPAPRAIVSSTQAFVSPREAGADSARAGESAQQRSDDEGSASPLSAPKPGAAPATLISSGAPPLVAQAAQSSPEAQSLQPLEQSVARGTAQSRARQRVWLASALIVVPMLGLALNLALRQMSTETGAAETRNAAAGSSTASAQRASAIASQQQVTHEPGEPESSQAAASSVSGAAGKPSEKPMSAGDIAVEPLPSVEPSTRAPSPAAAKPALSTTSSMKSVSALAANKPRPVSSAKPRGKAEPVPSVVPPADVYSTRK